MTPEMWGIFIEIVILLGFGFFFAKKKILTEDIKNGISSILLKLVLPISILGSSQSAYDVNAVIGFGVTLVFSFAYYYITMGIVFAISKRLPIPDGGNKIFTTLCIFGNVGFIGIPLANAFFGPTGLMYAFALNIAYNISLFSMGTIILSSGSEKLNIKKTLSDPCLICSVIMLVLYMLPFRMPTFITEAFTMTGNMMTPLAMLIIGYEIAQMHPADLVKDGWSWLVAALRLLVIPTLYCVIISFLPIDTGVATIIIFLLAMPCGTLNVILSQQYNVNPKFASRATTLTMILFLVTVPIMLVVIQTLL